ncbi:carbonic anhydrase 14 isoform X1 [Podarcis raffonei]|uniref:carbonic anhydrase 14 isoform X1 n=2 Tax=Podarcis raffonei TaxID=65483 RepID=UPI0023293F89|nr:carbonic anhydrase 14 isoform X1 [Podarcis raffonei]
MLLAVLFLQVLPQVWTASGGSHWTYEGSHGQEHWPDTYPDCGWKAQSPINIETGTVQYDPSLPPVETSGYRNPGDDDFTLINNGHTVQMSLPPSMQLHGLPKMFTAVQLHLHWGRKGSLEGSEHKVDGRPFPAELHVVHYNSEKYSNVSLAMHHPDGLAVLGVFLEAGDAENPAYNHILDLLDKIQYAEQKTTVAPFNVRDLLPVHLGHFFRYNGSLTTPPCFQSVLWTVFHQPVQLSAAQLEKLQKSVYSTAEGEAHPELLVDNFRAPQSLNGRVVLASFPVGPPGYSAGEIVAIIFGVILGCLGIFLAGWIVAKRIREKRMEEQKGVVFTSSSRRAVLD